MEQVSNMEKKMEKTLAPNPLPTPEEPLRDSFDSNDGVSRPMIETKAFEHGADSQEKDQYTPQSIVGSKRSFDELDPEKEDSAATTEVARAGSSYSQDWQLFPEHATTELSPAMVGATGKPRVSVIAAAYNANPKQYLSLCLEQLHMMRKARREAAEQEKRKAAAKAIAALSATKAAEREYDSSPEEVQSVPKAANKRQKTARRVVSSPSVALTPSSSTSDIVHNIATPARPTRARQATPAPNMLATSTLSTPPPTAPRRPTPSRKVADTPKKTASRTPAVKKPKPSKAKPKSSINDKQDSIKARLNKRYEDQGMNTAGGKGAHWLFEDAYIPPMDLDQVAEPPMHERTEIVRKDLKTDDPCYNRLHPKEVIVASWMRASASEYLTQKRRFFLGVVEWYRSGYPEVKRAHAQSFCNQDGNSTTYMHETFKRWGWFERSQFPDEILNTLPQLFGDNQSPAPRSSATPASQADEFEE